MAAVVYLCHYDLVVFYRWRRMDTIAIAKICHAEYVNKCHDCAGIWHSNLRLRQYSQGAAQRAPTMVRQRYDTASAFIERFYDIVLQDGYF